jgi:endonuclease/exonuclease/phosphatase (EEP) superfamily protein YafD
MTPPVQQPGPHPPVARWLWKPIGPLDALIRLVLAAPLGIALICLGGIGHRWFDILAQFTAPALVVTAALTLLLALTRLKMAALHGLAACIALSFAVAPQWFPADPRPEPGAPILRLYSANLWARNTDVESILASIRAADADVVVLIELGDAPGRRLDEVLVDHPHRITSPRIDRPTGPARSVVASRLPITPIRDRPDGLHAVGASVQTPLGLVHVLGVHLTRPWPFEEQWGQISQTMALQAVIKDLDSPLIVAGDFNSVSSARIGRQIRDLGLHPAAGFPGTWPTALPAPLGVTIDQVYASPDLAFASRRLGQPTGSDHRPVITELSRAVR